MRVVYLEPEGAVQRATEGNDASQIYRPVEDAARIARYAKWLDNESAHRALRLFGQAREVAVARGLPNTPDAYYVALIPGGNHAAIGFRLRTGEKIEDYPHTPFIKLEDDPKPFEGTFLHETGHVVLYLLNGARSFPGREVTSIPHSTATLSDRGTALSEGFAIHLETLAAHLAKEPGAVNYYQHRLFRFGSMKTKESEYHRGVVDLLTFAQTFARYQEVRDNAFAFESAYKGPDYLRVQLDPARDFATLRNANQLLQSEGFYATFFFSFVERGDDVRAEDVIQGRYQKVMNALAEMFATQTFDEDSPHLLHFVESYGKLYPDEASQAMDVLLDLSHGVFVDPEAANRWRGLYGAALRLDMEHLGLEEIKEARARWKKLAGDSKMLYSQVGAEISCKVKGQTVQIVAFGSPEQVMFDLNTAPEGVMRIVPGITEAEVQRWVKERWAHPFESVQDFKKRAGLRAASLAALEF